MRMDPLLICLSQPFSETKNPNSKFIGFKSVTLSNTICCMEATDAISIPWIQRHCYAFSLFCLIPLVLSKIQQDQMRTVPLITPCWQTQLWYPQLLGMLLVGPNLIPSSATL